MRRICLLLTLLSMIFFAVGCTSEQKVESNLLLPEGIPDFVQKSDFEKIDWGRKAVEFGDRGVTGNKNKSGVIGPLNSSSVEKWMWHLWGVENVELTVVGFRKETNTIHPILYDRDTESWYWTRETGGAVNGADTHMPSNVKVAEPGEWAILLYTNDQLFDTLVFEVKKYKRLD